MGNLDNKSKLSELEKAIMKKWLVPVSMQGVPSLADFNKHRDNASIHFKLKAGENISITVDEPSNTYTVTAQGGKFDGNLPDNDLKVGTADYAYSKGQFIVVAQTKLSTALRFSIIDKETGEEFVVGPRSEKWTAQRVIEYINSVSGFPATAELDHTEPAASGSTAVYVNLTANTAGPNYTIDSKFTIRDMVGGKAARKIYLNGVDITPATEVSLDSNAPITSRAVALALVLKQDELEWDELPTNGSYRPVYSTGIYSALQDKQGKLTGGTGIYIDGNYIAVDATGSVTLGDLAPVSGDTVARALSGAASGPEPLPTDGTKLKNGHKYVTTITPDTTSLDLSGVDLEDNASCELWIDNEYEQNPPIVWPHAYWLDSAASDHSTPYTTPQQGDRGHYSLRKEGSLVVGRLAYISPIPE